MEGDAGFGFSAMAVAAMCRYRLPVKIVALNNGGMGGGIAELPEDGPIPPRVLLRRGPLRQDAESLWWLQRFQRSAGRSSRCFGAGDGLCRAGPGERA
ncbi:MAG: hypothetical protein GKR94_19660 [Gammaproteobacteria bacterium]|nr:hypothetical protein [Gammaproteobacteria bacterium]